SSLEDKFVRARFVNTKSPLQFLACWLNSRLDGRQFEEPVRHRRYSYKWHNEYPGGEDGERIDLGSHYRLDRRVARGKRHEGRRVRDTDGHRTRNSRRSGRPLCVWIVGAIGFRFDWFHSCVVCGSVDFDLAGPATEEGVTDDVGRTN